MEQHKHVPLKGLSCTGEPGIIQYPGCWKSASIKDGRSDPLITTLTYKSNKQANPRQITWPAVYKARPFI